MDNKKEIEVKNISKNFGKQKVLNGINIVCNKGEITGIVGRNGSGKTVLLKCICDLMKVDEGEILIGGKNNVEYLGLKKGIGAVIEEPAFLGKYSGIENLLFLYGIGHPFDKEKIIKAMIQVGLDPDLKKPVEKYSMGMKQRLAIAQAIMENQDIILLDEPMNGLDIKTVEEMRAFFLKLRDEGKTILLASHNEEDINQLCNCIYKIEYGRAYTYPF